MNDEIKMTGWVKTILTDADGSEEVEEFCNLVVTAGRNHAAGRMKPSPPNAMSHIAVGSGSSVPDVGQTALVAELARKSAGVAGTGNSVTYSVTFGPGEGTGDITEAAILNAAAAGDMLSRVVFSVRQKTAEKSLTIIWTITFN